MISSIREQLDDRAFLGVVEYTNDPRRTGKVRVRIEQLHGRIGSTNFIPTEHLPWAAPDFDNTGGSFSVPAIGKVVNVTFMQGDIKRPVYDSAAHLNYNLQDRLNGMSDAEYSSFYTVCYDDRHQYYHSLNEGIVFDYVKSQFNIRPNGDMVMGLRDNAAKFFLGSPDASQPMMLGGHFMAWFDKFMQAQLSGAFLGNLGAPVIPTPLLLEITNEYMANREKFLSDHCFLTDDQRIKPQTRPFDKQIPGDKYNTESSFQGQPLTEPSGYVPEPRLPGGENPVGVHPTNYATNLSSTTLPHNPLPQELLRLAKPFAENLANGNIPLVKMTISKYLSRSFPEQDERSYLLDDAALSLDKMLDAYAATKAGGLPAITLTKGYQNATRQTVVSAQFAAAPAAGNDPFGWGNQAELFWGISKRDSPLVDAIKHLLDTGVFKGNPTREEQTLMWLLTHAKEYKWRNVGRDANGDQQWWHWLYDPPL